MAALLKLKDLGWNLTEEGLKKVSEDGKISDIKELVKRALDIDLREISNGGLATDFAKSAKYDTPAAGTILQIQKIRNVSAPKANEESKTAPRLMQVDFTDGQTFCSGLEFDPINSLSINTPPGTKVLLKGNAIKIVQGMFVLATQHFTVCGGQVSVLYEKWDESRTLAKYAKGVRINRGPNGPPPWIPFGQKNPQNLPNDKSFKSLNAADRDKKEESKESIEFTAARNEAILEADKIKQKKVFGGGNRQLIDYNVKKILDKGYTEEQAKMSLKYARNNLEKAMGSLKRRDETVKPTSDTTNGGRPAFVKNGREDRYAGGRGGGGGIGKGKIDTTEGAKPSAKVSLFDFLEDKIKIPQASESTVSANVTQPPNSYQKKPASTAMSSSTNYRKPDDNQNFNNRKFYGKHENSPPLQTSASSSHRPNQSTATPYNKSANQPTSKQSISNQSSSSSSSQQQLLLDNRSKFENNISASFASSRQKRDDGGDSNSHSNASSKSNWSGNNQSRGDPGHKSYAANKSNFTLTQRHSDNSSANNYNDGKSSKSHVYATATSATNVPSSASRSNYSQNNSNYNSNSAGYQQNGPPPKNKGASQYNNNPSSNNSYNETNKTSNRYEDNNTQNFHHPNRTLNNKSAPPPPTNVNHLVDATASMKISSNSKQSHQRQSFHQSQPPPPSAKSHQQSAQNQPPPQSTSTATQNKNAFDKVFPQMQNGFEYNPYKIMGFRNKEANEFALNLLKTQQQQQPPRPQSMPQPQISQQAAPQQQHQLVSAQQPQVLQQRQDSYVPMQIQQNYLSGPPRHHQQPPQQQQQAPPKQQMAPHYIATPVAVAAAMQPPNMQTFNWQWKVHDICFAKYWEDGRFYNAEITGMGPKTCVVQFMEYGNFEEVLLTDCLPITEANIQSINQYNTSLAIGQQQQQQQQQQNSQQHYQQQQRFRGERQMYVPPAQRSTKN